MNFREKKEITDAVEALMAATEDLDRGDTLTHERIEVVTGLRPKERPLPTILVRYRRRMLDEREIALWPDYGIGFTLVTKNEQLTMIPQKRITRAARQTRKAKKVIEAISTSGLSLHQQRMRAFQMDVVTSAEHELRSRRARQSSYLRKTESHPRPGRPQPDA